MSCRYFGIIALALFWASSAWAIPYLRNCAPLLSTEEAKPVRSVYSPTFLKSAEVTYTVLDEDSEASVSSFMPEVPEERKLIVVFSNAHTYVQYGNTRLDSKGNGGFVVKSFKRENSWVKGDAVLVLHGLSDESVAELQALFGKHYHRSVLSCAKLSSGYIKAADSEALPREKWTSSGLFQSLIRSKLAGSPIEVYTLNSKPMEMIYREIRKDEMGFMIYETILTGGLAGSAAIVTKLVSLCL